MNTVHYQHQPYPTAQTQLDNGLTVISVESPWEAPMVQIVIGTGSFREEVSGIAHLQEHMTWGDEVNTLSIPSRLSHLLPCGFAGGAETGPFGTFYTAEALSPLAELVGPMLQLVFRPTWNRGDFEREKKPFSTKSDIAPQENHRFVRS